MDTPLAYRGNLDTLILKLLEIEGTMYGYAIGQRLRAMSDGQLDIKEGALYPALHKLESKGWLTSQFKQADGRRRKYYTLTESGVKATAEKVAAWRAFAERMETILSSETKTRPAF